MLINNDNLSIILKQYKNENISEEEAIQLINGLYNTVYYPYYPPQTWNPIKYETTCTNGFDKMSKVQ